MVLRNLLENMCNQRKKNFVMEEPFLYTQKLSPQRPNSQVLQVATGLLALALQDSRAEHFHVLKTKNYRRK